MSAEAPTAAQERVLGFFGVGRPGSKREASRVIGELFADEGNRRRWNLERAREKLRTFPDLRRDPQDPQDSHTELLRAAILVVKGFCFADVDCRSLLAEYAQRSDRPWSAAELEYKLTQAAHSNAETGFMLGENEGGPPASFRSPKDVPPEKAVKLKFDAEKLAAFAGDFAREVDLVWLANRSVMDPATVSAGGFLASLYRPGERVLVFTNERSQGDAVWPVAELPDGLGTKEGVWFLAQPVDGEFRVNPRTPGGKMSRRSMESVLAWRFMVIESDEAPARLWLGALVRLPLRIAAVYTSAAKSVHALVQVDARTKSEWDEMKRRLLPGLVTLGADDGSLSAVRLTRLPGCWRRGRRGEMFPSPRLQKLLYLAPEPQARPLCELTPRRDVVARWEETAAAWSKAADPLAAVRAALAGVNFYASVSARMREVARELAEIETMMMEEKNDE